MHDALTGEPSRTRSYAELLNGQRDQARDSRVSRMRGEGRTFLSMFHHPSRLQSYSTPAPSRDKTQRISTRWTIADSTTWTPIVATMMMTTTVVPFRQLRT